MTLLLGFYLLSTFFDNILVQVCKAILKKMPRHDYAFCSLKARSCQTYTGCSTSFEHILGVICKRVHPATIYDLVIRNFTGWLLFLK